MKLKKNQMLIAIGLMGFLIFFIILEFGQVWKSPELKKHKISVITRQRNNENWTVRKSGIDQATIEMNVKINFVTLSEDNSVEDQIYMLKREVENGAEAIIISAVDSLRMKESIENVAQTIPVVTVESSIVTDKKIPYISCDNNAMGAEIAEKIMAFGNTRKVIAVLDNGLSCDFIKKRQEGFFSVIDNSKNKCLFLYTSNERSEAIIDIKNYLLNFSADVVVALDDATLEMVAEVAHEMKKNNIVIPEIYGIGSTKKIAYLLEEDVIKAIIVQNEFNMGYICVEKAINLINQTATPNKVIDFTIIDREHMYKEESQRVLFPFIR